MRADRMLEGGDLVADERRQRDVISTAIRDEDPMFVVVLSWTRRGLLMLTKPASRH